MESNSSKSCSTCGSWWRLPLLLGLVLAAILLTRGRGLVEAPPHVDDKTSVATAPAGSAETVSLTIDFGNGRRQEVRRLAWHEGVTVADLIGKSSGVSVTQKGSGESAFLTAIDGVANEGADGRNWTYAVNGQNADRSYAVYELRPGDQVLWTFAPRP